MTAAYNVATSGIPGCRRQRTNGLAFSVFWMVAWMLRASMLLVGIGFFGCGAYAQQSQLYSVATIATSHPNEQTRAYFSRLIDNFNMLQRSAGTHATLYYVNNRAVNAFATIANGQYIVVLNSGLLTALGSDSDAVAAVMGHELGHVLHNHVQEKANVNQLLSIVTGLAGLAVDIGLSNSGHPRTVGAGQVAGQLGYNLASTAFTRDQEREADHESVRLVLQAGLDPNGAVRVMEALQRLGGREPPLLFATHPPTAERLASLQKEVAEAQPEYEAMRSRRDAESAAQRKDNEARISVEVERKRQEGLAREALHEETTKAVITKGHEVEREAALVSQKAQVDSANGKTPTGPESEKCTDISPTRRSCASVDKNGQLVVRTCSRTDSGEWQCKIL